MPIIPNIEGITKELVTSKREGMSGKMMEYLINYIYLEKHIQFDHFFNLYIEISLMKGGLVYFLRNYTN